ncbi:hypothetical protein [Hyalangium sp.]|uniref:hypothetical protein n=1 Tax=Hyalangium sp. TaxID=2028555 RepID=UPI002D265591|nr:hypothetical protein [Hyalangium sp.]HYH99220.1 hypothetical protein [Hyalangium sp.]
MLYKVTPMMAPAAPEKVKAREQGQPRKKRKSAVYDAEGHEVLISLMCLKCRTLKPLAQFGLRKMADGAIRNQPWCRTCRSGAGTKKPKGKAAEATSEAGAPSSAAEESTAALQVMTAEAALADVVVAEAAVAEAEADEAEAPGEEEPKAELAPASTEG